MSKMTENDPNKSGLCVQKGVKQGICLKTGGKSVDKRPKTAIINSIQVKC